MSLHAKTLDEPWFSLMQFGHKTYDIRLSTENNKMIRVRDKIIYGNYDLPFYRWIEAQVISVSEYKTFEECLSENGIQACFPNVPDMEKALAICADMVDTRLPTDKRIIYLKLSLISTGTEVRPEFFELSEDE